MSDRFAKLKELAVALPDSVKGNAQALIERMEAVIEGIGDETVRWRPSLLKMVQSTTDRSSLPKGVGIGDFVLGENKIDTPLEFFPIRLYDQRQYWDPDPQVSKMICNSPDGKLGRIGAYCKDCPHRVWDEENKRSDCSSVKSILAIRQDLSDIFSVNFTKTSYVSGMELGKMMAKAGVATFKRMYALSSTPHAKQKNVETYAVEGIAGDRRVTPAEYVPFLQELFSLITTEYKEMLDKFYEVTLEKVRSGQLVLATAAPKPALTDEGTTDLSVAADETAAPVEEAKAPAPKTSPMAKGYKV